MAILFILPAVSAIIGATIEIGSPFRWVRCSFTMPNITNPKNGSTVTGGGIIEADLRINFTGTTILNQQSVANEFAQAWATAIINREIMEIINT